MKKSNYSYLVWGVLFLVLGVIWAGNIGNYWNIPIAELLFRRGLWTFFIIFPCIVNIIQKGFGVSTVTAIVVSFMIFCAKAGFLDLSMVKRLLLPLLLIILGGSFFFRSFLSNSEEEDAEETEATEDAPETTTKTADTSTATTEQTATKTSTSTNRKPKIKEFSGIFCSKAIHYDNLLFPGCSISSTFGEVRLNLSGAAFPEKPVTIHCSATCGTIDIHLPERVNVIVTGTPLLSGLHNYRKGNEAYEDAPTIKINITSILGGIDIR